MKRKFRANLRIRFINDPHEFGDFIRESLRYWNNDRPWETPSFGLTKIEIEKQNNINLDCFYYIYSSGYACPEFFIKEIIHCYEETN